MAEDIPDTGAVFTFGKSLFADNEPSHFFIKNDPVVAISCGDEHSAVICQNGRVFVFGANSWGQLGLGHTDETTRPSCVKWLKPHRVMFVACGRAHTVFVTDTNSVYSVGCNEEGQLGTGDTQSHFVPQYVQLDTDSPVRQISAGNNHTAILTDEGRVFVCGSNAEGQLGLGEGTRSTSTFTELKFMEKIAFIECGYYQTVFITTEGVVFITGDNENQKLGISKTETIIYTPQVLPIDIPIKSVCCGAAHTFLLSMDEGKILAFGSNERGQLGMSKDVEFVTEPKEIDMEKLFDGFQLKLVACGAMHTAFLTDNGLLYTCGEADHNKLCLDEGGDSNGNEATDNQYAPRRVTAMNGFIVDNVACGGCHTLLSAIKGSNADFTNNGFLVNQDTTMTPALTELPPLKIPTNQDHVNSNTTEQNGNMNEENVSINSLEANVSGSHIVNINDLDAASVHDVPDINKDEIDPSAHVTATAMEVINDMDKMVENAGTTINNTIDDLNNRTIQVTNTAENTMTDLKENISNVAQEKKEAMEDLIKKTQHIVPGFHCDEKKVLSVPDKITEIANSPPPKSPIIQDLLHIPDLRQMSPSNSKHSDDGQKSENGQSENETIPCDSDKSSPLGKTAKTQAVLPIVRSDDHIDMHPDVQNEAEDVVVNKDKGRFAKIFQSIKDKENSCMGKGKVIEETVVENVHKGIEGAEETVHKVEETIETEIRNQTNSRTCTIL